MQRAVASALFAGLMALPLGASADDAPTAPAAPDAHAVATPPKATSTVKQPAAPGHDESRPNSDVTPVAITAKRTHPRLDLRLTSDRLNRVLDDSGVEPVAEADPAIDAIEVTARRVQEEPITQAYPRSTTALLIRPKPGAYSRRFSRRCASRFWTYRPNRLQARPQLSGGASSSPSACLPRRSVRWHPWQQAPVGRLVGHELVFRDGAVMVGVHRLDLDVHAATRKGCTQVG